MLQRQSTRSLLEVEETSKHVVNNSEPGSDHNSGMYRWLDKIYEAQIVNYGKRLMLEIYVPEPAAYYREIVKSLTPGSLTRKKPEMPTRGEAYEPDLPLEGPRPPRDPNVDWSQPLQPQDITWPKVQELAARYGVTGLQPPPPDMCVVGASIEVPFNDRGYDKEMKPASNKTFLPALGATKVSMDLKIPQGYVASHATWTGDHLRYVRLNKDTQFSENLPDATLVSVGAQRQYGQSGSTSALTSFSGILPIAVITSAAGLIITFRVDCIRTTEFFQEWKIKTYDAIMVAYRSQLQEYEEELAQLDMNQGIRINGRPTADNRKIERDELKRASISMLRAQYFDDFGAIRAASPQDKSKSPKIDFDKAAEEAEVVQYFEQIFEWHNMTYIFYPYFGERKTSGQAC